MKAWLKLMVKLRNDGKWIRLSDLESKVWVQALLCARMAEDACSIPGPADIALELHREDSAVEAAYERLASIGWLALDETGWTVPKFAEVQGDEKDREFARLRKARQREKSRCVTMSHDESRVTDPLSRCVTVGHALEERRLEETRGDKSLAPSERLSLSGTPAAAAKKRKPRGDVIEPEKRDPELAEFFDMYRFAFATNTRPQSFWGRNKIAEGYRAKASDVIKALGLQTVLASLGGAYFSPYWQGKRFGLENAVSVKALNASLSDWQRQTAEKRAEFAREFNAWRAAQ
jgi:hypothetical protein